MLRGMYKKQMVSHVRTHKKFIGYLFLIYSKSKEIVDFDVTKTARGATKWYFRQLSVTINVGLPGYTVVRTRRPGRLPPYPRQPPGQPPD